MSVPLTAIDALAALEQALDLRLAADSEARQCLAQPLDAVRRALHEAAADPEAKPALELALDRFEDVLEARMRAAGWPTAPADRDQAGG